MTISLSVPFQLEIDLEIDDDPTDIGWAWALTVGKGEGQLLLVRKSIYGADQAKAIAFYLLKVLKAEGARS